MGRSLSSIFQDAGRVDNRLKDWRMGGVYKTILEYRTSMTAVQGSHGLFNEEWD
jgi:hypothetical protein